MKSLSILLGLLATFTANAATEIHCESTNFDEFPLEFSFTAEQSLFEPGTMLTISSRGASQINFPAVVESSLRLEEGKISVRISTLNRQGEIDQESGIADLYLEIIPGDRITPAGTGSLTLIKKPKVPRPIVIKDRYELKSCRGNL